MANEVAVLYRDGSVSPAVVKCKKALWEDVANLQTFQDPIVLAVTVLHQMEPEPAEARRTIFSGHTMFFARAISSGGAVSEMIIRQYDAPGSQVPESAEYRSFHVDGSQVPLTPMDQRLLEYVSGGMDTQWFVYDFMAPDYAALIAGVNSFDYST